MAGIIGISTPLGQVGGTYFTRIFAGDMTAMLMIPAAVCVVCVLLLAATLPDRRLSRERAAPFEWSAFLRSFRVSPRKAPDFAWVCAGRFFLMSRLGFLARDVPDIVFRSTLVQAATVVFAGLVAGRLSDLTRRRKPFVIGAALACGVGSWVIAMSATYGAFLAGITLFGAGLGAYLSVDLALITDVLPNEDEDAAKDLGLFNIASALPQSIAPAVASMILLSAGGSYAAVFMAAGIVGSLAAVAVMPVRSVH